MQTTNSPYENRAEADIDNAVSAARSLKDDATQVTDNFNKAVQESVSNQPMTTLAMAIAVGFVLGAIWKA